MIGETGPSKTAMRVLALVLAIAGLWVARIFLLQIAFAVILAVAIWPLYRRLERRAALSERRIFLPLAFTLATGVVLILPFAVIGAELVRDSAGVARWLVEATHNGVPPPDWLRGVPGGRQRPPLWWEAHPPRSRG